MLIGFCDAVTRTRKCPWLEGKKAKTGSPAASRRMRNTVPELGAELMESGFAVWGLFAIEGVAGWLPELNRKLANLSYREILPDTLARVEQDRSILGIKPTYHVRRKK